MRKPAGFALQIGKHPVAPILADTVDDGAKALLVIHRFYISG